MSHIVIDSSTKAGAFFPYQSKDAPKGLLQTQLSKALRPKDKSYRAYDSGGLYLEISPSGSKLWRLKYRFQGKEKRLSFGAYPGVSLREAEDLPLRLKKSLGIKKIRLVSNKLGSQ